MSEWQRPEWLGMVALGTTGGQPLVDGGRLQRGIHLRWSMGSSFGFPPGGFDIHRRQHDPGPEFCAHFLRVVDGWRTIVTAPDYDGDFTLDADVTYSGAAEPVHACDLPQHLTALAFRGQQTVRIALSRPVRCVRVVLAPESRLPLVATGLWNAPTGRVAVAQASVRRGQPGSFTLELFADRLDEVLVEGRDFIICRVCMVPVAINLISANLWESPLNATPIHLPVDHPEWPTPYPDDAAEAKRRLPSTLPANKRRAYADSYDEVLFDLLYGLVGTRPQSRHFFTGADENAHANAGTLTWNGLQLLQLMALDPNYARILGLYAVDTTVVSGAVYDYMVVGHWGDARWPGPSISFRDLSVGDVFTAALSHHGLGIITPRALTAVDDLWNGTPAVGLRIGPGGLLLPPVWLQLPQRVPSVSLLLRAEGAVKVRAYDGRVAAGPQEEYPAGEHVVRLEPSRPFDRMELEAGEPLVLFELILHERAGPIGDLHYATFRHRLERPAPLPVPRMDRPVALPGRTGLGADGMPTVTQGAVGLRWELFAAGGGYLRPGAPLLFQVGRTDRGDEATPVAGTGRAVLNDGVPIAAAVDPGLRPPGHTGPPLHFVDSEVADGWFEYAVRGIDLFGRLGSWSQPELVEVRDRVPPPPPPAVRAFYLDPDDPSLAPADRGWAAQHGSGLRVTWEWGGRQRLQAPDVGVGGSEFRIYVIDGPLNMLRGRATAVTNLGITSEVTTDQRWAGGMNALAGEWVRVGQSFFPVVGNTEGDPCSLTVENLTEPAESPRPGNLSLAFSRDRPYWTDYRDPTSWKRRLAAETAVRLPVYSGAIVSTDAAVEPVRVVTDQSPASLDDTLTAGVLISGAVVYRVDQHALEGGALVLYARAEEVPEEPDPRSADTPATVTPVAGSAFLYYPGRAYSRYVDGFQLSIPAGEGTAIAHVTVSTSDGRADVADDPRWALPEHGGLGGRLGNEGPAAPAQQIIAVIRRPLAAPAVPTVTVGDRPVSARPADYYGIARYTLTWEPVPGATGYAVFRSSGAALVTWDRGVNGNSTPEGYGALADPELQALASRADTAGAFRRVNPEPVATARYEDRFDGRGRGVFLYRVAALDVAGNPGELSAALPPVHIFDVTPPETPRLTRVLGGERSVTLGWRANREADLLEYRLWRAETATALADVRRIHPAKILAPTRGAVEESYTDTGLVGGHSYHYRLAAVDANGNVSAPTAVQAARAVDTIPPAPPRWTRARWNAARTAIELRWRLADRSHEVLVQRTAPGSESWMALTGWLPAGTTAFADANTIPFTASVYRLKVRSVSRLVSVVWPESAAVPPAPPH